MLVRPSSEARRRPGFQGKVTSRQISTLCTTSAFRGKAVIPATWADSLLVASRATFEPTRFHATKGQRRRYRWTETVALFILPVMNAVRAVQCVVYLLTALVLLSFTLGPLMWVAWGPPGSLPQYLIALCGAFGLAFSAIVSLRSPVVGRYAAVVSLAALGVLWVPGVVDLVPQHGIRKGWEFYSVLFAVYLAAVGFALLYPVRWRWSVLVFALVLAGAMVPPGIVALQRYQSGEYSWPSFAYFRWYPDPDSLLVINDRKGRIDPKTKSQLERLGIRGRLDLMGISGRNPATRWVIVLAQRPPTEPYELHIPRADLLVYAFDGLQWHRIPEGAATYPSFAVLEPNGLTTRHCEIHGVGRSCSPALTW